MKGYILKNRPYKFVLMMICEGNSKSKPFDIIYMGFRSKTCAIDYFDSNNQRLSCLYACVYKKTCVLIRAFDKVLDILFTEIVN